MSVSAPSVLASYVSTANVTTSGPVAIGSSVSAGTTLYLPVFTGSATTVLGITDSQGNVWVQAGTASVASGAAGLVAIWYSTVTVPLSGADTITVTRTVAGGLSFSVTVLTGVDAGTPIGNGGTTGTGSSTTATTSVTTTALASVGTGDLVVMAVVMGVSYVSATAGASYSIVQTLLQTGGTNPRGGTSEYQIAASGGSFTPTLTLGAGQPYAALSLVFKSAAASSVSGTITAGGVVVASAGAAHPTVAEIGDSLTFRANANDAVTSRESTTRARFLAAGYATASFYWKGVGGKSMVGTDSTGTTTLQNITSAISQLGSPIDKMIIALGTNDVGSSDATFIADCNSVLSAANSAGVTKLLWIGIAFKNSANTNALHFNPILLSTVNAQPFARFCDWAAYVHNGRDETGLWNTSDATHMTTDGYQLRDEYIIAQLAEVATVGSTSVSSTVTAGVSANQVVTVSSVVTAVAASVTAQTSQTVTAAGTLTRVLGAVGAVSGVSTANGSVTVGSGLTGVVSGTTVAGGAPLAVSAGEVTTAYITGGTTDYAMLTVGATLHFAAQLYDADPALGGVLANASSVTLTVTLPDGTSVIPIITNPPGQTGRYSYDMPSATQVGRTVGRWVFTMPGGNTASYVQQFSVAGSDPGYLISLSQAKAHLNIPQSVTTYDPDILEWLAGITPVVEHYVGACVPRTVVDYAMSGRVIRLDTTPVLSLVSLVPYLTAGRTYSAAECRVTTDGRVMLLSGLPFSGGPFEITYRAGRIPIPWNVIQAAKIILGHLWETQRGASGLPLQGTDDASPFEIGYSIPNRAIELLRPSDLGPAVG